MRFGVPVFKVLLASLLVSFGWRSACAQTGGGYDLTWSTLDCGSAEASQGDGYRLQSAIGQAVVGDFSGGGYALHGGFWVGGGGSLPTDAPPPDTDTGAPLVFRLQGNAPNPFSNRTAIAFSVPRASRVELRIYDLAGRVVRTLLDGDVKVGRHQIAWDSRDDSGQKVAHGIYLLRLRAGKEVARRKIALVP